MAKDLSSCPCNTFDTFDVNDIVSESNRMVQEIKKRSRQYVDDNFINPTPSDYLFAENLAIIGSCVALEMND